VAVGLASGVAEALGAADGPALPEGPGDAEGTNVPGGNARVGSELAAGWALPTIIVLAVA
jgi:hypothetical protein